MKEYPVILRAIRTEPSTLASWVVTAIEQNLGVYFKKFKPNWSNNIDENGIEFDAKYSSYYQQDDNYYSYAYLKYDETKYSHNDIRNVVKDVNAQIKGRRFESTIRKTIKEQVSKILLSDILFSHKK